MNEERLYDYSKGLNAPYWIKKSRQKGHSTMVLCNTYAVVLFIVFIIVLWPCYSLEVLSLCHSQKSLHSISLLLYWYLPLQIG